VPSLSSASRAKLRFASFATLPFALGFAPMALAQAPDISTVNGQTQTPIPGSGHDYQHLLGETVDPSNGSVNFKISFPVAKSRGITIPYAWSYNSAAVNPLNMLNGNTPEWDDKVIQAGPETDGWNTFSGLPYAAVSVWNQTPPSTEYQTFAGCNIQSGMTFTDMSGTLHNLYTAAESTASTQSGLVQTCGTQSYMPANGDGQVTAKPDPNTGINNLPGSNPSSGSFVVTDKNGTNYSFPGNELPQSGPQFLLANIEDRNGNTVGPAPEGSNALYTDSAGRLGPVVGETSVTINSGTPDQLVFPFVWESVPSLYSLGTVSAGDQAEGVTCAGFIPTSVNGTRSALKSLTLPNGESYQFSYGEFGLLDEITYPDGGYVVYNWELPPGTGNGAYNQMASWSGSQMNENQNGTYYYTPVPYGCSQLYQAPVLYSRTVSFDGSTVALSQIYSYSTTWASDNGEISGWSAKTTTVTTTDEETGLTSKTVYSYIPWGTPSQPYASLVVAPSFPVESEIDYYDWGQTAVTKKVNKTWYDQFNLQSETTTIVKTGQVSKTNYSYVTGLGSSPSSSSFVYLSEQDDYDYSSSSTPIKKTVYNYRNPVAMPTNFSNYKTYTASTDEYPMMFPPLVSSVTIENGSGAIQASTNYTYDGAALTSVSPTQHDASYSTSMTTRGNLTSVIHCNPAPATAGGACSGGPTISYTYDTSGQPKSMTDANGNTTTYSFADSFSDDSSAPSTNAYLTSVTLPSAGGGSLSESFQYSYNLGYLTKSTDTNGQPTTYTYNDPMNRLTQVNYPDTGEETIAYTDTAPSPTVTTTKLIRASVAEKSVGTMDGMGHVVKTQLTTDPGGADTVLTTYNGEGKVYTVTNPFRGSSPPANTKTTNYYDVFGRPIQTTEQDGNKRQWCYDDLGSSPAVSICSAQLVSSAPGTFVDSADENGNHWQHTSDVFGNLTYVMEPNGTTQTPSMETKYTYDVLNDLATVSQCGALCSSPAPNGPIGRSFSYNSLGQLATGANPETGSDSYTYDLNGNVLTKVSPALNGASGTQTIGYCYDALNHLVGKWSATPPTGCNSTPTSVTSSLLATYAYGPTSNTTSHTGGRLTDEKAYLQSTLVSEEKPTQYDPMGRLQIEDQCPRNAPCSTPYIMNYSYDLAGDVIYADNGLLSAQTELDFTYNYDGAQHLMDAETSTQPSGWGSSTYPKYVLQANETSTPAYDPWGHLVNGQLGLASLGSGTPVIQVSRNYDNRGRITTETDGSFYSFSVVNGSSSGYDAVGNLKYYQDSVMGNWSYSYNTLNQATAAQDTATTSVSTQFAGAYGCWTYDGFGNRKQEALSNATSTPCVNGANDNLQLTVTTPTAKNQVSGLTYDLAGNVRYDNANSYYYDAEGRLCAVAYPNGSGGSSYEQYLYNASGTRVGKGTVNSLSCNAPTSGNYTATLEYLTGLGGEQVTELNGTGVVQHTNVFGGSGLLATYDFTTGNGAGLHFALADLLGTKRVQVTPTGAGTGNVELQCMSLPFGNGLGNPRVTDCVGSGSDATEHHFTGKERDTESGNDYFVSRYYGSSMGRFTSPDDGSDQDPSDPQSWNLYSYVRNNPLVGIDPSGQDCIHINVDSGAYEGTDSGDCDNSTEEKANSGQYVDGTVNTVNENSQGQVTGFSGTSDDGNLMAGSFRTSLPSTGGFDPGSLGASVFGGQNSSTWNNASGTVDLMARIEFEAAGFVFPVSHLAVVVLAGRPQNGTAQAGVGGLRRKPGTLGQFGNKSAENGVAKQVLKRTAGSGATKELVHEELQALSQDLGRPATIEEGVEAVLEALR